MTVAKSAINVPPGFQPRMLDQNASAIYCGLGTEFFMQKVESGVFSKGVRIGRRILWDRLELDKDLDRLVKAEAQLEEGTGWGAA